MKKTVIGAMIVALSMLSINAFAQKTDNCTKTDCPQAQTCQQAQTCPKVKCDAQPGCFAAFDKLNLTDEQKAKLQEVREKNKPSPVMRGNRQEARSQCLKDVKAILTPEQYVQFLEINFVDNGGFRQGPGRDGRKFEGRRGEGRKFEKCDSAKNCPKADKCPKLDKKDKKDNKVKKDKK